MKTKILCLPLVLFAMMMLFIPHSTSAQSCNCNVSLPPNDPCVATCAASCSCGSVQYSSTDNCYLTCQASQQANSTGRTVMKLPNFLGTTQFSEVIGTVIKTIIGLVGSFALIMFIYGGGLWLISAGRKEFVDKGKKAMIWAAVGLAVVFASYILVNTVFDILVQT